MIIPYRKDWEVIGFYVDADTICLECAESMYGPKVHYDLDIVDRKGNPVTPVYLGDEFNNTPACGYCLEPLDY